MITLEENEHIVYEIRKHLFYFYAKMGMIASIVVLIPLFYYIFIASVGLQVSGNFWKISVLGYLLFILLVWIYAFIAWTDYFLDTWIVTEKRIIDFELKGLFSRDIATVRIEDVQDLKITVVGFLNTFLKIGNISIQTAGSDKEFMIKNARDPEEAKKAIAKVMHKPIVNQSQISI